MVNKSFALGLAALLATAGCATGSSNWHDNGIAHVTTMTTPPAKGEQNYAAAMSRAPAQTTTNWVEVSKI